MIQLNPETADFSKLSRQQLQQYISSLIQQYSADSGLEYLTAWRQAKSLWPKPFAALDALPQVADDTAPIISNAQSAAIPQLSQDSLGLYNGVTDPELSAVWKACNNSLDPAYADKGFSALCDLCARSRNLSAKAAESAVRIRFPALSTMADEIKVARKLGVNLPSATTSDQRVNRGSRGAAPRDFTAPPPFAPDAKRGPTPSGNPSNPFRVGGLANDLSHEDAVDTFTKAIADHMKASGENDVAAAHAAVSKKFPELAAAVKSGRNWRAKTDPKSADAAPSGVLANERQLLNWIIERAQPVAKDGSEFAEAVIAAAQKRLAQT